MSNVFQRDTVPYRTEPYRKARYRRARLLPWSGRAMGLGILRMCVEARSAA
ncbi:MAG: hypothetical protein WC728_09310 [Elusimicrobiota bacterium]